MPDGRVLQSSASAGSEEEGRAPFFLSLASLGERLATMRYWVRELFGENAYARYVAGWEAQHTDATSHSREPHLMTEKEFFELQLHNRYGDHVQRCC